MKSNDNWYKTSIVANGVIGINENNMDTMYLIEGSEKALLLDTGWGIGNLAALIHSLTDLPVTVIHTHGHIDHVSGAWQFGDILIPYEDEYLLAQSYNMQERQFHHEVMLSEYIKGSEADRWINAKLGHVKAVRPDSEFELGDRRIIMHHFPGHTRGSAVFFDENNGLLFTGDSIFEGTHWLHTEDSAPLDTYFKSLRSLISYRTKIKMLLPAHGKTPVNPGIIEENTSGVQDILDGKLTGIPTQNHAGQGLLYQFEHNAIIYDPKNLRA